MKYRSKIFRVGDEKFDSLAEFKRYNDLVARQLAGEIKNLRRQVSFPLAIEGRPVLIRSPRYKNGRQAKYTADFVYEEFAPHETDPPPWRFVVEECKGYDTTESRLRRAVFEAQHQVQIRMSGKQAMPKRRRAA